MLPTVVPMLLERVQLRQPDDDREAIAKAEHDGGRHKRDELVCTCQPDEEHEGPARHHRREQQLDAGPVPALLGWRWDHGGDDGCKGTLCAVHHTGSSTKQAADQAHNPCGVDCDVRLYVCHEGEGHRLGDLGEADGDAQQNLVLDETQLLLRGHGSPFLELEELGYGWSADKPLEPAQLGPVSSPRMTVVFRAGRGSRA
mmetsp:Transcript_1237/g.2743  ORF Transcript_1237/g.2743 Transcript_1237/m.2743 type:complete len:200 (-) Transcript_1237:126-725(-)